jgi:hypothetical protein
MIPHKQEDKVVAGMLVEVLEVALDALTHLILLVAGLVVAVDQADMYTQVEQ